MAELYTAHSSLSAAAGELSKELGETITAQMFRRWMSQRDTPELSNSIDRIKLLTSNRTLTIENGKLRRDNRDLTDAVGNRDDFEDAVERIIRRLPVGKPITRLDSVGKADGKPLTVEVLLSDLQIGKLGPDYNTDIARRRLFEYGQAILFQVAQKAEAGYRVEEVVLALIGDIIESDKKHDNSARATDTGTAEQMHDAMEGIFDLILEPLARLGIKITVVCITGNHDWDDHGLAMFQPGRQQLSFPMYKFLEKLTHRVGYDNVNFIIPDGSYAIYDIYGQTALYEHGVGVSNTEISMKSHKIKRAEQERKHITYFRMGDKHTVTSYNSGQLVVNGAFFAAAKGGTEYSGIVGYSSYPAQWIGFHVPRKDDRLTLYDNFTVQLGHIK